MQRTLGILVSALLGGLITSTAVRAEIKPVTGVQWTAATDSEKKAFLYGLGTMIQLEHNLAVQQGLPKERKSFIPTLVTGLHGMRLAEVKDYIDSYYRTHSDRMDRPVVDILWSDLALPRTQQAQLEGKE